MTYAPFFLIVLFTTLTGSMIYLHELWGAIGFAMAAISCLLTHVFARTIVKLLAVNQIMHTTVQNILIGLREQGIELKNVMADDDTPARKDLH